MALASKFRFLCLLGGLLFAMQLSPTVLAGETITDEQRGFTFEVPEGFQPYPELVSSDNDIVHAFLKGDPTDDQPDLVVVIEMLGGTIGREPMAEEHFPDGFQGRIVRKRWQGFVVDGFEIAQTQNGLDMHTVVVQIPIKREAIQIVGAGVVERTAEVNQAVDQVLASLRGESNWLKSAVPAADVTSSRSYGWFLLGGSLALVVGGLVVLWYIRRETPKGTVFAIALMLFFFSVCFVDKDVRELMALKGSMRLLGFLGIFYGIYDLVRPRKPRPMPEISEPDSIDEPDAASQQQ